MTFGLLWFGISYFTTNLFLGILSQELSGTYQASRLLKFAVISLSVPYLSFSYILNLMTTYVFNAGVTDDKSSS